MTGQEIIDNALLNTGIGVSQLNLGTSLGKWQLYNLNKWARMLYYYLNGVAPGSKLNVSEPRVNDFYPLDPSQYPAGAQDALLLNSDEEVVSLFVKYSAEGRFVQAQRMDANLSSVGAEYLATIGIGEGAPRFSIRDRAIQVFPKPAVVVPDGVSLTVRLGNVELTDVSHAVQGVPGGHQDALVTGFEIALYQRMRNFEMAQIKMQEYQMLARMARNAVGVRAGRRSKQPVRERVYF